MFLDFGLLMNALLLALGMYWCYEVGRQWRTDLSDLRELDDTTRRVVIVGRWGVTAVILVLLVNFAIGLAANVVRAVRAFV